MAKGNVGNLLQHFVVLAAAERLRRALPDPKARITYVDCFSMAPWEAIPSPRRPFQELIRAIQNADSAADPTARAFQAAWANYPAALQDDAAARTYPNTAVLLHAAFPDVEWQMRLHDVEDENRAALNLWGQAFGDGVRVQADWETSPLIRKAPIASEEAVLLVLDPYQVVPVGKECGQGDLPVEKLRLILGEHALSILKRPVQPGQAPAVVALFSYSESSPDVTDRAVRTIVEGNRWRVDRVTVPALGGRPRTFHQAWWIASSDLVAGTDLPNSWGAWAESLGVRVAPG